jgi:hypothetical protein
MFHACAPVRWGAVIIAFSLGGPVGCGEESPDADHVSSDREPERSRPSRPSTSSTPDQDRHDANNEKGIAELIRERKPVRTPGGGVAWLAPPPSRASVEPSRGCSPSGLAGPSERPPRPGIRARRIGPDRLLVKVVFGPAREHCAPDRVRLSVDVSEDYHAPAPFVYSLPEVAAPFVLRLPGGVKDADAIGVSSIRTESGTFSDSREVRIVDW